MRKSLAIPVAVMVSTVCFVLVVANAPNSLDGIESFLPGAIALLGGIPVFLWAYGTLLVALLDRRPIRAGVGAWAAWTVGLAAALCLSALGATELFGSIFLEPGHIRLVDRSSLLFNAAVLAAGVAGLVSVLLAVLPGRAAVGRDLLFPRRVPSGTSNRGGTFGDMGEGVRVGGQDGCSEGEGQA